MFAQPLLRPFLKRACPYLSTLSLLSAVVLAVPVQAQNPQPYATPMPFRPFWQQDSIDSAVQTWERLRETRGEPFANIANFLMAHPGWPGEDALRDQAEAALRPETESPSTVIAFFQRFPAKTATAQLRYAEALYTTGQRDLANNAARIAWVGGPLSTDDESRFLIRFNTILTPPDQNARMDRLLWNRALANAERQLTNTSADQQPLFAARLALLTKAPNAEDKAAPFMESGRVDPGFVADRAAYLLATGQDYAAEAWLARPMSFNRAPLNAHTWLNLMLRVARKAEGEGQYGNTFNIARQVGTTYPQGTDIRARPFDERDAFTSLAYLGGDMALNRLGRYADAAPLFDLYTRASKFAFTQARGLYWAGRAEDAAGARPQALAYYGQAATYYETFFGQLADERLGQVPRLGTTPSVTITPAQRDAYMNSELARAAIYLGQQGEHTEQTAFMREIAKQANSDPDLELAVELGARLNRTDMGVWASRNTRGSGGVDFIRAGFPRYTIAQPYALNWTIIHAIARQETNFDSAAVSRTNARGLMQLEPYTARPLAEKNGLPYDYGRLTSDPAYNMALGSLYYDGLMTRFGGCYPCAVGAYNAGPGWINQWIARNGDPRSPSIDVVRWIEAIPITETRGYVMNVLENAVVYDLLNPNGPSVRSAHPLSTYLGR
ncbi:MAG: lytic transglycosylase domain-containing protein [Alphaproteobacteria bacterium]|nr:lytic transglycosylase domain-containing protein [Alphaproteobacteria bacterium]MDE2041659.1 lytic transglycosylase domain-containing protein [Alphaproteobacteria bacterium]MDE2339594.1 lytic transglycosylase domain-containing protein [Alphaproteobacteria bacterium]